MSHLPDITEGAAVRLAAWLDQYELGQLIDACQWAMGGHEECVPELAAALDALMAHLDKREAA